MKRWQIVLSFILVLASILVRWGYLDAQPQPYQPTFHEKLIQKIIFLESSGRHENCWGDHHTSFGICQFKPSTFEWMKAQAHMEWLSWKNREDQILLMSWAINHGLGHHWSTYRRAFKAVAKEMSSDQAM